MPDTKKNIEAALNELKRQKVRLEKNIRELALAREERVGVMSAIKDLEHALKTVRGRKRATTGAKKPGPKPRKLTAKATRKKPGPKPKAKKTEKKPTAKGWTPAKRAAQARKVKAFWAAKKKADAKPKAKAKKKPGPKPKAKKTTKKKTNRSKGWTPAKRAAAARKAKAFWAKKKKAG